MVRNKSNKLSQTLERFSLKATKATGTSMSFILALSVIVVWGLTGPLFHFSDTWQLVINTSTTIVTFLMVFLIQRTQNKDAQAIHLKLNEIVAALEGASNNLIDVEDLTEGEIETLHTHIRSLSRWPRRTSSSPKATRSKKLKLGTTSSIVSIGIQQCRVPEILPRSFALWAIDRSSASPTGGPVKFGRESLVDSNALRTTLMIGRRET